MLVVVLDSGDFSGAPWTMAGPRWLVYVPYIGYWQVEVEYPLRCSLYRLCFVSDNGELCSLIQVQDLCSAWVVLRFGITDYFLLLNPRVTFRIQ
jgi:hypothetical protein